MIRITTPRLTMRSILEEDRTLFFDLHSDHRVIERCFDPMDEQAIEEKFAGRVLPWELTSGDWLSLVIIENETGNKVGITGFKYENNIAELGYLLLPKFYGHGYCSETLTELLNWAYETHKISDFKAVVTEGNVASESVLKKCNFILDEIIPQNYQIGGCYFDDHVYIKKHTL
ncbi:GNAT family N-acetyltransferase [Vibrio eleionomae]|uniref:GNAT family N-acetyltransferase n=1 Tax=Vibrio eleionomae TaxID=2653505 RepID=UPI0019287E77|nr:GNAT family N-acetyltransferase [Vibrio eleionomae]